MSDRPPVERPVTPYWRDPRIDQGCVSERGDIAETTEPNNDTNRFEDELLQRGLSFEHAETAAQIFVEFCEAESQRRAADALRELLLKIRQTKVGKSPEFSAILAILSPDTPVETIAKEVGLSQQTVSYHVQKLRGIL